MTTKKTMEELTLYTDISFAHNRIKLSQFIRRAISGFRARSEHNTELDLTLNERGDGVTEFRLVSTPVSRHSDTTRANKERNTTSTALTDVREGVAHLYSEIGLVPLRWNYTPVHLESVKRVLSSYIKSMLGIDVDNIIYNPPPSANAALEINPSSYMGALIPIARSAPIRVPKEIFISVVAGIDLQTLDGAFASSNPLAPLAIHTSGPYILPKLDYSLSMNDLFVLRFPNSSHSVKNSTFDVPRSTQQAIIDFDDMVEILTSQGWVKSHTHAHSSVRVCARCDALRELSALWPVEVRTADRIVYARMHETHVLGASLAVKNGRSFPSMTRPEGSLRRSTKVGDWMFADSDWLSGMERAIRLSQPISTLVSDFVDADPAMTTTNRWLYLTYISQIAFVYTLDLFKELDVALSTADLSSQTRKCVLLESVSVTMLGEIEVLVTSVHQLDAFITVLHRLNSTYGSRELSEIAYSSLADAVLCRYAIEKAREGDGESLASLIIPYLKDDEAFYGVVCDSKYAKASINADIHITELIRDVLDYYKFCKDEVKGLSDAASATSTLKQQKGILEQLITFYPSVSHGIKTCKADQLLQPEMAGTENGYSGERAVKIVDRASTTQTKLGESIWDPNIFVLGWYGLFDYGGLRGAIAWSPLGFSSSNDLRSAVPTFKLLSIPITVRQVPESNTTSDDILGLSLATSSIDKASAAYRVTLHSGSRVILSLELPMTSSSSQENIEFVPRMSFAEFLKSKATSDAKELIQLVRRAWSSGVMLDSWSLAYYAETGKKPKGLGFVHVRAFLDKIGINGSYLSTEASKRLLDVLKRNYD